MAAGCSACQATRNNPPKVTEAKWPCPSQVWHRVHVDFAGPVESKMLMLIVDATSKWPEVMVMSATNATETVEVLRALFARFGLPVELVRDNGPQFTTTVFAEFVQTNGIRHLMGAMYHPATNGLAERLVQTAKNAMK